jgi:hypothetical protein
VRYRRSTFALPGLADGHGMPWLLVLEIEVKRVFCLLVAHGYLPPCWLFKKASALRVKASRPLMIWTAL